METDLKKEMSERALRYMDYLEETLQKGGDFVSDQAPEVVRELILYHRVYHSAIIALSVLVIISWIYAMAKLLPLALAEEDKPGKEQDQAVCIRGYGASIVGGIASFLAVVLFLPFHLGPCLKVWLAPRVFILEEIARLL